MRISHHILPYLTMLPYYPTDPTTRTNRTTSLFVARHHSIGWSPRLGGVAKTPAEHLVSVQKSIQATHPWNLWRVDTWWMG